MNSASTEGPGSERWFVTTHWSVVLAARGEGSADANAALEALCRTYWYPLYSYARRSGCSPADAEDLTQGFLARLLAKDYLRSAAREKGRFRTFLLTALKRFMANEWDHCHAQKRGGFATVIPIDQQTVESRFASEGSHNLPPDVAFDRQWASALLERTLSQLQTEYEISGRSRLFQLLRPSIAHEESTLSYAEIGGQLHLSEAAVKMAVHRLRGRYRELLQAAIADTVGGAEEIEDEIRHLFAAFA